MLRLLGGEDLEPTSRELGKCGGAASWLDAFPGRLTRPRRRRLVGSPTYPMASCARLDPPLDRAEAAMTAASLA